jgi:hypothetical protein
MQQAMVARVTCPSCSNQIQVRVEQVLDVRADPTAKMRLLNHSVNAGVCPHCRAPVGLSMPLLYHDPDKQLALVLMPMDATRDNMERQAAIGQITRAVMDSLPAEERKGYLLTPQVFMTMDNLVKKVLDEDGVTPEMIAGQRARAQLIQRMLDASSDEVLDTIIQENTELIDDDLFRLLSMNLNMVQSRGDEVNEQRMAAVRDRLMEQTEIGRVLKERTELLEELRDEQTREKLLDLLIKATDETARRALITVGRPLVDYSFFVGLTSQIDATEDPDEKERLKDLRQQVLDVRDQLDQSTQAVYQSRSELLRDLLMSENTEKLARRRFREIDEIFMNVLATNLEEAQKIKNEQAVKALQGLWRLILRLVDEATPPQLKFFSRLMQAEDEAGVDKVLEDNKKLVDDRMLQAMEQAIESIRAEGTAEDVSRMELALGKARSIVARSKLA